MLVSIVIPAHNRPALLLEALHSLAGQTYLNLEVIVVDDGSAPAISRPALQDTFRGRMQLYRHDAAQGIPKAKNAGIRAAHGDVILLLDDDDLLMPDAIEEIVRAFSSYPTIDCLFMGVQPFGPYAEQIARRREVALKAVLDAATPEERDGLYFFSDRLFGALLRSVPIDFQRPAARRGMWNIVGGFDEGCLFSESTWAIRASCTGTVALTKKALTKWRIHDANFGWPPGLREDEARRRQMENGLVTGARLLETFGEQARLWRIREKRMRMHYSDQLLGTAFSRRSRDWRSGMDALFRSFVLAPRPIHLRQLIKYCLPVRLLERVLKRREGV